MRKVVAVMVTHVADGAASDSEPIQAYLHSSSTSGKELASQDMLFSGVLDSMLVRMTTEDLPHC